MFVPSLLQSCYYLITVYTPAGRNTFKVRFYSNFRAFQWLESSGASRMRVGATKAATSAAVAVSITGQRYRIYGNLWVVAGAACETSEARLFTSGLFGSGRGFFGSSGLAMFRDEVGVFLFRLVASVTSVCSSGNSGIFRNTSGGGGGVFISVRGFHCSDVPFGMFRDCSAYFVGVSLF